MIFAIKHVLINSVDFYTKIFFYTENFKMDVGGVTRMDRIENAYIRS